MGMINKKFIGKYSDRYQYGDLSSEKAIFDNIKQYKEFLDENILYQIASWKSPRSKNKIKNNTKTFIKEVTEKAFSSKDERFIIEALTLLQGVQYAVASAILFFRFPAKYTIIDFRAWWTLKEACLLEEDFPGKIEFKHWEQYLRACRDISKKEKCSLRELDKALWQYSKENQRA